MSGLFTPIQFREISARNRVGMSPMCMWSAASDGKVTDWHVTHYATRAAGGAGLVFVEATAVHPEGRISPADLGLWGDDQIPGMTRIAQSIRDAGALAVLQIAHAGRKGSLVPPLTGSGTLPPEDGGWIPVGPSALAFNNNAPIPIPLDRTGIEEIRAAFVASAARANEVGFDAIEIHAAHGYLLSSFLSPLANKRDDHYSGSRDGRALFLLETVAAVQKVWPKNKPVFVRISTTDWHRNGWSIDDSVWLAAKLREAGVDLLDCSSGGNTPKRPTSYPGFQVPLAAKIREESEIPVAAVGMISSPDQAEMIIQSGQADIVLLGREFLRDPYWPLHAAQELRLKSVPSPKQYAFIYR